MYRLHYSLLYVMMFLFSLSYAQDFTSYAPGTEFISITVDANNNIWAGTETEGLYLLDQINSNQFVNSGLIPNDRVVSTLAADELGYVWIGNAGHPASNAGGGIHHVNIDNLGDTRRYSSNTDAECLPSYFEDDGVATLDPRCIRVDKNNKVWSAQGFDDLLSGSTYSVTPGAMSFKEASADIFTSIGGWHDYENGIQPAELPYPAYTCNPPATATPGGRPCTAIATGDKEVWMSVYGYTARDGLNYLPPRVLRYDLAGNFLGEETHESMGIPTGGVFNGLHINDLDYKFVTVSGSGKGFLINRDDDCTEWTYMKVSDFPDMPANTRFSDNAIWSNAIGEVFLGTNQGLLIYNGLGNITNAKAYSFYTTEQGLLTNDIIGGHSESNLITWLATDNGIIKAEGKFEPIPTIESIELCEDPDTFFDMYYIEDLRKDWDEGIQQNESYHDYEVLTEICSKEGINGEKCCTETVFQLIKNNVILTAPLPQDFPTDNLNPLVIGGMSDDLLVEYMETINAWQPITTVDNPTGAIREMKEVLPLELFTVGNWITGGILAAFFEPATLVYDQILDAEAEAVNSNISTTESCQKYLLYNNTNFIGSRIYFQVPDIAVCGGRLESVRYDPIYVMLDESKHRITNYTGEGHMLFPGFIQRTVIEQDGKVFIHTLGQGNQYCAESNIPGGLAMAKVNANGNVVAGGILFKNIDLRLKKAFEEL